MCFSCKHWQEGRYTSKASDPKPPVWSRVHKDDWQSLPTMPAHRECADFSYWRYRKRSFQDQGVSKGFRSNKRTRMNRSVLFSPIVSGGIWFGSSSSTTVKPQTRAMDRQRRTRESRSSWSVLPKLWIIRAAGLPVSGWRSFWASWKYSTVEPFLFLRRVVRRYMLT